MPQSIKLAQIGGGSTYTPDFAKILIQLRDELPVREWVLMDIDPARVEIVANFTRRILQDAGMPIQLSTTTDLRAAVTGADFVITTMRAGQSQSRVFDETIPQKHGMMIGQETTAPGGLMMGLRNIPVILDVAHAMEELASPDAWLINLANPSGMLSEALNRYSKVKFAGLCNGPTVAKEMVVGALKADPKDVFLKTMGLNHLVFMRIFYKGKDVSADCYEAVDDWIRENIAPLRTEMAPQYVQKFTGWHLLGPYLRFYYQLPESVQDHVHMADHWPVFLEATKDKFGALLQGLDLAQLPTRAHFVQAIEKITLDLYARGDLKGYELVAGSRGGRGYGEAGLALASAIWNDKYEIHAVDVPNRGTLPGLEYDDVVTATSLVNRSGIYPLALGPLPRHMMSFVQAAKNYERLAVDAAVSGDYHQALEALVANPLIVSIDCAKAAFDELLLAQKDYLPQFAGAIRQLENGQDPLGWK